MHLALLLATLAALLSGPLLYVVARPRPALLAFLDGFVLVSIAGLVLIEAVPGAFSEGGLWSLGFLLLGLLGPTALEQLLTRARREAHLLALALAVLGLILHSFGDGAALSPAGEQGHEALALAVAIHSIPVGLVVWWLLFPVFGAWLPALALAGMAMATIAGYRYGLSLNGLLGEQTWAWFQALIAGSILHVVFGRPHLDEDSEHHHASPPWEGLGNLAGLAVLVTLAASHGHGHDEAVVHEALLPTLLALALQLAPALLLAYGIGGLVTALWPPRQQPWLQRVRSGDPSDATVAAQARGIAPPLLSLIAVIMSLPLLGLELTGLRAAAIALLAATGGWMLSRRTETARHPPHPSAEPPGSPWRRGLRAAGVELVDQTAPWILAGLLVAALFAPHAGEIPWSHWPGSVWVVLLALLGIPLWLCATGLTPLVAVLIAAGLSPGAGLALLLTGPALGLSGLRGRGHHARRAWPGTSLFITVIAGGAMLLGWAIDAWLTQEGSAPASPLATDAFGAMHYLALIAVCGLYASSLLRKGGRGFLADLFENHRPHRH